MGQGLSEYRRRRDFSRTAEPLPGEDVPAGGGQRRFVVQIHDAGTLHFDFRLEADGVLKSWAVPKGPSSNPHDKRLAMPTEDHPLEYLDFEGVIGEGQYGAGAVIVWAQGTYRPLPSGRDRRPVSFAEALRRGHASFWLDGGKLRGGYALTRFRTSEDGGSREAWLLVKENDTYASDRGTPDPRRARSVLTGRTLGRVVAGARGNPRRAGQARQAVGAGRAV
ncbi:DNA polymerase ligase N-terminal domain-containing protein [Wenjunlia tyrosinilytica]|uniref:3'-phosphoesterase n=1 Tax=Wenjunlia tyrosinilytica TaxID=1544741 RepID=A0A917ZID2_9ACTN|nr:DNA polymerase ligase N-terminal domain-containing protein [Wenjunlia tyrosinilytica]GGO83778.1 3'-phosphoesterase [Wenjunlia tyrosinilytica]